MVYSIDDAGVSGECECTSAIHSVPTSVLLFEFRELSSGSGCEGIHLRDSKRYTNLIGGAGVTWLLH